MKIWKIVVNAEILFYAEQFNYERERGHVVFDLSLVGRMKSS